MIFWNNKKEFHGIDRKLSKRKWDLIHFNYGLHALKAIDKEGRMVSRDKGEKNETVTQYSKNMDELVTMLKKHTNKLIFATTTPVPEGEKCRIFGDEVNYNKAAIQIMEKNKIPINDLRALVKPQHDKIMIRAGDVHFTADGYDIIASQITDKILKELK